MKNYDNGFRHITVFGETVKNKAELDNFLKEKNYDFEEENDGLRLAVKEAIGTNEELNKNFKVIMTRVPDDKESVEKDIIDYSTSMISSNFDSEISFVCQNIEARETKDIDKEEEKTEE